VQAAVSPDGKFFAYAADHRDGRQSINLAQVDSPEARLTIAGPEDARYGGLTFSPDGLRLYFVKYACNGTVGTLHQMAALGGKATKIKENIPRFFSYALSPDGKTFAFVRNNPEEGVSEVVTAQATHPGEEGQVAERRKHEQFTGVPAWSPDGTLLTCALRNAETGRTRLVGLDVATGKEEFARDIEWEFVGQVASLPDEGSLILSSTKIYGPSQMWHIPYPGGRPKSVTGEGKNYDGMSPTADSGAVLTVEDRLETYIRVAPAGRPDLAEPIDNRAGEHNDFWGFSWTPDGRILYVKNEESGQNIWVMSADGKARDPLTEGGYNVDPCATPDGRHVVFTKREGGSYDIWRMNADKSGAPKKLTDGGKNFTPHCSADGTVVYTSERHGQWSVMKMNVEGGRPVQLHHRPSQWPAVSPGGSVAFFTVDADGTMLLGVLPAGGGAVKTYPIPCTVSTWAELRWLKPEQELTYVDTRGGVSNLWSLSLPSGAVRQLTHFDSDRIFRYDWSADGRLVLSRGTVRRDAVLFNFREPPRGGG
jgi:Tol biopolymer transport system component